MEAPDAKKLNRNKKPSTHIYIPYVRFLKLCPSFILFNLNHYENRHTYTSLNSMPAVIHYE